MPGWVSAPQAHRRVSNINFDILNYFYGRRGGGGGSLEIFHENYIKDGKFLAHFGFQSKICPGPTLIFEKQIMEGGLYKYPMKNILRTAKFFPIWGVNQMYCPGL